jgi:PDZ domain-containing protein
VDRRADYVLRPAAAAWRRSRPTARTVLPILALALVLLVGLLPAPYLIEVPGPVVDTLGTTKADGKKEPLIGIPGRTTYPTTGRLDLLTVTVLGSPRATPSWIQLALAWFDREQAVVPLEEVYPQGASQQQLDEQGTIEMTDSQQDAKAAALRQLGYAVPATVQVAQVQPGSAASGRLRAGDVVRTANGKAVTSTSALQAAVRANGTGHPMAIGVTRAGRPATVSVTPKVVELGGQKRPLLGIGTSERFRFPFTVDIRLANVSGPSAGMMFALGIIDKLTPGALTGGKHIAGTGTIDADGTIGAIGGIAQKMAGARAAGATVFLAPKSNCDEVRGRIPAGLTVYAVGTLKESLRDVKAVASGADTRRLATCSAVDSAG